MWTSHHVRLLVMLSVFGIAVPMAGAQTLNAPRPERPYRGLFGGGVNDAEQSLTASASAGGGYDTDIVRGSGARTQISGTGGRMVSGGYGVGSAALAYSLSKSRISIGASGNLATRYYPDARDQFVTSRIVGGRLAVRPFENTQLYVGETVSFQPYNLLDLFPALYDAYGARPTTSYEDFAVSGAYYTRYATSAGASQGFRLGRRSTLDFTYTFAKTEARELSRDYITQRAGATLRHNLTKGLTAYAGYSYTHFDYPSSSTATLREGHSINAGVDFDKALSLTRRTTLTAAAGTSSYVSGPRTFYRLNGNAQLSHEMGRSWSTSMGYSRNMTFIEVFNDPVFYDALTATLSGLPTRRLEFSLVGRVADGRIGVVSANRYRTYMATASLTTSFTRNLALSGAYFFNQYEFDPGTPLPSGVSNDRRRHGVRVTLSVWAPLLNRARKP